MGWTDADTVKTHLLGLSAEGINIQMHELELTSLDNQQLPHNNLKVDSIKVAAMVEELPIGPVSITITDSAWTTTGSANLMRGRTLVATDQYGENRLVEGSDYAVNEEDGTIVLLPQKGGAGSLAVYVWILPLTVYEEGIDYEVEYARGMIQRVTGSDIEDPQRVFVWYSTAGASADDTVISLAIIEAEDKIAARLRDGYTTSSTDQGLITGATELSLSIICDDLALQVIAQATDSGADDRGRRMMDLSRRFEDRASGTLSRFLTQPLPGIATAKSNNAGGNGW